MINKGKLEEELKQGLTNLYRQLLGSTSKHEAKSCYQSYRIVLGQYDQLRNQQFYIEAWKIEGEVKSDTLGAIGHMKDDVAEMYRRTFNEHIPGSLLGNIISS
ncbi:MAG: hypothetical protein WCR52_03895 [Bacteroidota bacterium]